MKRRRISREWTVRLLACSLAAAVAGSTMPLYPVMAATNAYTDTAAETGLEKIEIASAEELMELAENCHIDEWSENKLVILTADIDLAGSDFANIPVFKGVFDGSGHKITNYCYEGNGYVTGFFRYIEEGGIVKNLYLTGSVISTDDKQCVGALCGINKGTISGCTFQGLVSGKYETGGITGINEASGVLEDCKMRGTVTGYYYTGGITGKNYGTITGCANSANVNNNSEWVEEDDEISVDILQNILANETDVKLASGVDTGGIAGFSKGMIIRCTNSGKIGYEHTGYNIGGIVGRQSGVVTLSTNHGAVYGRKDVGGVVGQMEPYIEVDEAESIRDSVNRLHDLIQIALDDMEEGTDAVRGETDILKSYSDAAIEQGNSLSDRLSDFADDNLTQMNELTERMERVLEMLPEVLEDTDKAGDSLNELNEVIEKLNEDLKISDKMSSSYYDETDYRRLSVSTSVGGDMSVDKLNSQEGTLVTVTLRPDNGYETEMLKVTDAAGRAVAVTQTGERTYTFTMPHENVLISAMFHYAGAFLAKSNEGGTIRITNKENGEALITAEPLEGYELSGNCVNVGGRQVAMEDSSVTIKSAMYLSENKPVLAEGVFVRKNDAQEQTERIVCVAGTGGQITAGTADAAAGEEVYLVSVPETGYRLSKLSVVTETGTELECQTEAKRFSFIMPEEKVRVTAVYEPVQIILASNLGGSASYSGGNDRKVTLRVTPSDGYTLSEVPVVKNRSGEMIALGKAAAGTWNYEFYLDSDTEPASVQIKFEKQSQSMAVEDALDRINANTQKLNECAGDLSVTVDRLRELITDNSGNIREWSNLSKEERTEVLNCMSQLLDDITQAGTASAELLSDLALIAGIEMPYVKEAVTAAREDMDEASEYVQDIIDSLERAREGLRGILSYLNSQSEVRFSKLGEEFDNNVDELCTQLQNITDSIKNISDYAADYSDKLNKDLEAVNNQLNVVFNLLIDKVENLDDTEVGSFYADVSEEEVETATNGRVDNCYNKGIVQGDINVGGIAGAMAIDTEDPEDNAAGNTEYSLGNSYTAKCIINGSTNQGYVTAKKDGAGGIAGYMKYGVITACKAYGSVESTEGDYVGGVCGQSQSLIKNTYALCTLSGSRNVGGIAGYGTNIRDCYSMVNIAEAQGRYGAIAGQTADDTGIKNNYYVGEDIYGIDNISYIGVAEPLTYEELLTVKGLPNEFWHLKVTYKIENMYLGTKELAYGESMKGLEFPSVPVKEGYYGVWPDTSELVMTGNIVIEGEYRENVTVLESVAKEGILDSKENGYEKSLAFVEGRFTDEVILHASVSEEVPPEMVTEKKNYIVYHISLENAEIREGESLSVRLLNPYENASVWSFCDGKWEKMDSKERGQYLQTQMNGTSAIFCIADETADSRWIIAVFAGLLSAGLLIVFLKKGIRRHKNKMQKIKE